MAVGSFGIPDVHAEVEQRQGPLQQGTVVQLRRGRLCKKQFASDLFMAAKML